MVHPDLVLRRIKYLRHRVHCCFVLGCNFETPLPVRPVLMQHCLSSHSLSVTFHCWLCFNQHSSLVSVVRHIYHCASLQHHIDEEAAMQLQDAEIAEENMHWLDAEMQERHDAVDVAEVDRTLDEQGEQAQDVVMTVESLHRRCKEFLLIHKERHNITSIALEELAAASQALCRASIDILQLRLHELLSISPEGLHQREIDIAVDEFRDTCIPFNHVGSFKTLASSLGVPDVVSVDASQCYVTVQNILSIILRDSQIRQRLSTPCRRSTDSRIRSLEDGSVIQQHPLLASDPTALRFGLYLDDITTNNPLSKKKKKFCMVYITIMNLSDYSISKLDHIFPVACIMKTNTTAKYNKDVLDCLGTVVEMLNEFANGVSIPYIDQDQTGGTVVRNFETRGAVAFVSTDIPACSLAAGIGEHSSRRFCRRCNCVKGLDDEHGDMNTIQYMQKEFFQCVDSMSDLIDDSIVQVNNVTPIWEIKYFDLTRQLPFDIMHNEFEGLLNTEIFQFMKKLFKSRTINFGVKDFQKRLALVHFCDAECRDKPKVKEEWFLKKNNAKLSLKLNAGEHMVLSSLLPLLIGNLDFKELNEMYECLQIHLRYVRLLLIDPTCGLSEELLQHCEQLMVYHHEEYCRLYNRITPKLHYSLHSVDDVRLLGLHRVFWCMRFEGYHKISKAKAQKSNNVNLPKTMMQKLIQSMFAQRALRPIASNRMVSLNVPRQGNREVSLTESQRDKIMICLRLNDHHRLDAVATQVKYVQAPMDNSRIRTLDVVICKDSTVKFINGLLSVRIYSPTDTKDALVAMVTILHVQPYDPDTLTLPYKLASDTNLDYLSINDVQRAVSYVRSFENDDELLLSRLPGTALFDLEMILRDEIR